MPPSSGASVHARDDEKSTPLHMAAEMDHTQSIQALVAAGASAEAQDINKATPLHLAAKHKNKKSFKVLMAAGAWHEEL